MNRYLNGKMAAALDVTMCAFMNGVQLRHSLPPGSRERFLAYVEECEDMTPDEYFAIPPGAAGPDGGKAALSWPSPITSPHQTGDRAWANIFPSPRGPAAPTVIILHALMSASDAGYRRSALRLNELGWNVCFLHLPYHYSRRAHGFLNGELAITSDLLRTAETLRQAVVEIRQLMTWCRARGCREFGLLATSWGAWIGALTTFVEPDFRFIALMTPIVNVHHAIWESPASRVLRSTLKQHGIAPGIAARHAHLTSPLHNVPLAGGDRALLVAGTHDVIARPEDVEEQHRRWQGSHYFAVDQGHFGYKILPATMRKLVRLGLLTRV